MLDKAQYSAFQSTLNSPIVSYRNNDLLAENRAIFTFVLLPLCSRPVAVADGDGRPHPALWQRRTSNVFTVYFTAHCANITRISNNDRITGVYWGK